MALKGKASNGKGGDGDFEVLDADTYEARLVAVVDLGVHATKFGDKRQVALFWELIGPEKKDATPWVVVKRYTLSFNIKATLRKDLEAWRRAPYPEDADIDLYKFLGHPWSVEITHSDNGKSGEERKVYANVGKVGPVPKAREKQVPMGALKPFAFDADEDDVKVVEAADWLPFVYGEKVLDLVQQGKRNLREGIRAHTPFDGAAEADDASGAPLGRQSAGADKPDDIPF